MGINIRQKGQEGEREIARLLNSIYLEEFERRGMPKPERDIVQRNQNQSAVGGSDLSNTLGFSIEVKRQEQLAVGTWWKQCVQAASVNNELPVLIYRQSRKPWRVVTEGMVPGFHLPVQVELGLDDFKAWFACVLCDHLDKGLPINY